MKITPAAQTKLQALLPKQGLSFRLSAARAGCQGYTYSLKLIHCPRPDDLLEPTSGLPIYIDRQSLSLVTDVVMDYAEDQGGFTFTTPRNSCSCSSSVACQTR